MTNPKNNPSTLAEQLDALIPPDSDMVLDDTLNDPRLDVAKMLAGYSQERLSETSRNLIHDRMMLSLDEMETKSWQRPNFRMLQSAAAVILLAGFGAWLALSDGGASVRQDFAALFEQDGMVETLVPTAASEIVTTAEITESATEETIVETPEITAEPTVEVTEIIEVIENTATPTETITPTPTELSEIRFVQQNQVNLRAEPDLASPIIATAATNDPVAIKAYDENPDWALVMLGDGTRGWVLVDFLGEAPVPVDTNNAPADTDNDGRPENNTNNDGNNNNGGNNNPPSPNNDGGNNNNPPPNNDGNGNGGNNRPPRPGGGGGNGGGGGGNGN